MDVSNPKLNIRVKCPIHWKSECEHKQYKLYRMHDIGFEHRIDLTNFIIQETPSDGDMILQNQGFML